ncbi:hypothetical protein AgCh_000525 [Apium graveolens]
MKGDKAPLSHVEEKAGPLVTLGDNTLVADFEMNPLRVNQVVDKDLKSYSSKKDELASEEQSKLWHKKLSHLNFKAINILVKKELVRDMPKLEFVQTGVCEACQKGKMKRSYHKSKTVNSIFAPLQLIHGLIWASECLINFKEQICTYDGG